MTDGKKDKINADLKKKTNRYLWITLSQKSPAELSSVAYPSVPSVAVSAVLMTLMFRDWNFTSLRETMKRHPRTQTNKNQVLSWPAYLRYFTVNFFYFHYQMWLQLVVAETLAVWIFAVRVIAVEFFAVRKFCCKAWNGW